MDSYSLNLDKYKQLCELTSKAVKRSRETERGELMKEMMEVLNISRAGKFRLLTLPRMGVILEGIPTDSLYSLRAKCKEAGELAQNKRKFATEEEKKKLNTYDSAYSKAFYWNIRVK